MDEYQRRVLTQFFEPLPKVSQASCHQFVLTHITPTLLPIATDSIAVRPCPFQGSMSYTAIIDHCSTHDNHRTVVQFRTAKQDLSGVIEASRIHGSIVPTVTYQGMYEMLFVYTSPFAEGVPYVNVVMSSQDLNLPPEKVLLTATDLADLVTRGARANVAISETGSQLSSSLDELSQTVNSYNFKSIALRNKISACISKLQPRLQDVASLPIVLTHQDLSPYNYLIEEKTGRLQAVLDWDGSIYLPIGSNFHFMESIFGSMTITGWKDATDRHKLESAFYDRVLERLSIQGHRGITKEQLELQKAIGSLVYGMGRLLELKNEWSERYLDVYLRGYLS
ncbi:hypothetical protein N7541_000206 [Penicillium brevicompactum]|uniref:Aminoglycoside phosphotransferase domain-containing protein n=1 Tax=Penicillium brevicompactum TaxID=5074 RepID=A0A9W9V4L3_PENBR|nr:hypothetical protein N7541_000206 [Penicillium brevicompactum]